jgi:thioredoxin-like negative regulator of GroEL
MLVYVTMDGCRHCHQMLTTTYQDQTVANEIRAQFVPTVINGSQQHDLVRRFGVRIFPTTFLVGPDNRVIDRIEGYVAADEMRRRLVHVTRRMASLPGETR